MQMDRAFGLMGVNVMNWYDALPRRYRSDLGVATAEGGSAVGQRGTISQFYQSRHCVVCDQVAAQTVCKQCRQDAQTSVVKVALQLKHREKSLAMFWEICYECQGSRDPMIACVSIDCPVYFERWRRTLQLDRSEFMRKLEF